MNLLTNCQKIQKKRHIPKKCPFLCLPQRNKSTLDRNVLCYPYGHTDPKSGFIYVSLLKVVVLEWTFTISLPKFLFSDFFILPQMFLPGCKTQLLTFNLYRNRAKCKIEKEKKIVFSSKVSFGEGSAAMGYLRFCFVVLIEAIRVILISRQRVSKRSYSADEIIFVLLNNSSQ